MLVYIISSTGSLNTVFFLVNLISFGVFVCGLVNNVKRHRFSGVKDLQAPLLEVTNIHGLTLAEASLVRGRHKYSISTTIIPF